MTSYKKINKEWWEKMVDEGCGFCKPWLNLDPEIVNKVATGKLKKSPKPFDDMFPTSIFEDIKGKNVLCLASGGGQQSAVFGLMGANVTIVDIAKGQLKADKVAAKHYGYDIKTYQGDMSDLSMIDSEVFDLVYQAPSMGYVPDVNKVYKEVSRVLKPGGLYRADAQNPGTWELDENSWDGKGYRISELYSVKAKQRSENENVMEYRHYISDVFNGLIDAGFEIIRVEEPPKDLYQDGEPEPGTWLHSLLYAPGLYVVIAKKK